MKLLRWIGILFALILLLAISAPFWIDANHFRPLLQSELSQALGRDVKLGDLKLAILSGSVTANDLSIADDPAFSPSPFVRAKSLKLGVELWPLLLSRKLNVTGLTIESPDIALLQSPSGQWNFSNLGSKSAATQPPANPTQAPASLDLSVKLVKITAGRFSVGKAGSHRKPLSLEQVAIELRDFSSTSVFPFSFSAKVTGGGEINLQGQAGPLSATDVAATPAKVTLKVTQLDLANSGLTEATPALAGLISIDASGESNANAIQITGKLKAEKLKLSLQGTPARPVVELDFAVAHDLGKQTGQIRRGDIHIGKAVASLTGAYSQHADPAVLQLTLSAPDMPVPELAELLPALGVVLPGGSSLQGGTASAHLTLDGPADRLVTAGTVSLNKTRLSGFDLGKKLSALETLAGIQPAPNTEIQTLSARIRVAPEETAIQDIKFAAPAVGDLDGGGTVSPSKALDFKMAATIHTGGLLAAMAGHPIPFTIGGTASDPVFRPDIRAAAKQELQNYGTKAADSFLKGLLGGKKKN